MRGLSERYMSWADSATTCDMPGRKAADSASSPSRLQRVRSRNEGNRRRPSVSNRGTRPAVAWGANVEPSQGEVQAVSSGQGAPLCEQLRRSEAHTSDAGQTYSFSAMDTPTEALRCPSLWCLLDAAVPGAVGVSDVPRPRRRATPSGRGRAAQRQLTRLLPWILVSHNAAIFVHAEERSSSRVRPSALTRIRANHRPAFTG
jgi:hypothetical protein